MYVFAQIFVQNRVNYIGKNQPFFHNFSGFRPLRNLPNSSNIIGESQ